MGIKGAVFWQFVFAWQSLGCCHQTEANGGSGTEEEVGIRILAYTLSHPLLLHAGDESAVWKITAGHQSFPLCHMWDLVWSSMLLVPHHRPWAFEKNKWECLFLVFFFLSLVCRALSACPSIPSQRSPFPRELHWFPSHISHPYQMLCSALSLTFTLILPVDRNFPEDRALASYTRTCEAPCIISPPCPYSRAEYGSWIMETVP